MRTRIHEINYFRQNKSLVIDLTKEVSLSQAALGSITQENGFEMNLRPKSSCWDEASFWLKEKRAVPCTKGFGRE